VCVLYLHYSFWKTFLHYLINLYKKKKLGKWSTFYSTTY
jgi:hypothetical protein